MVAARLDPARVWQLGAAGLALCIGLLAGIDPKLAIAAALALGFVLVITADVTIGLCLFVLVSFVDVANFGGAILSFSKIAGILLAASWLAAATTRARRGGEFFTTHPALALTALLFLGWSVISLLWAEDAARVATSTQRYALNLFLLPIVFTAIARREHVAWVAMAFVSGAICSLLVGIASGGTAVAGDAARLAGGIGDANELAAVLTAAIVLALALAASPRIAAPIRLMAVGAAALALVGILATLSRGGLVALAFALVAGLLFGGRWRGWFALALVVAAVGATSYVAFFAPAEARARVQSTSSTGRSDIWTVGLRMVQAHPVRGVGGGNFPAVSVQYLLRPGVIARDDFIIVTPKVAHNIYLEVQAELGVIGFLLFFFMVGTALACAIRAARAFKRQGDMQAELLARGVVIALAGILASDFFVSEQYSKQLWVLLALGPAMLRLARVRDAEPERT